MTVTPETEALRKRLAKIWQVAPYRIDVGVTELGVIVALDGKRPTDAHMEAFGERVISETAKIRQRMN
jgi:hypothetical protein